MNKWSLVKVWKIFPLLFLLTFSLSESQAQKQSSLVRIAIVKDVQDIELTVRCPYRILALHTNEQLAEGRRLWHAKVTPTEGGIKIVDQEFKLYGIRIQPTKSPAIYLNGRKFRGAVDIIRQADKSLLAINHLDVEEYVSGVLYHEVAPWWPMEALKAQAIVARSFALYQSRINAGKDYDLVSTVYSQVYGGRTSERGRTSKAVRLTKNKVLSYQNKLFPAFYHATCAGYTEDAANLWKINILPLKGRKCEFCQHSPHLKWDKRLSLQEIGRALEKGGFLVGAINGISIIDRDISGRILELEITTTEGEKVRLSGNRFRLALGPNIIRSTNFEIEIKETQFPFGLIQLREAHFQGYGWGHGVGMCQWGAFFMSREGFNAEQILGYYYPESKIKDLQEVKNEQGEFETY